jgi:hypothetical protein
MGRNLQITQNHTITGIEKPVQKNISKRVLCAILAEIQFGSRVHMLPLAKKYVLKC